MVLFEWLLLLLFAAVLAARLAAKLRIPYPVFLAVGGAAVSFVPGAPTYALDPALALALFVAPVLLDAAYDTSLRDLKDNGWVVAALVVAAVGATTAAVAFAVHALVPGLPWAAAVALGAVVAPPDAAAATAVLRTLNPPHRILVILQGESLLNDASALLIYRIAVAAVAAGGFSAGKVAPVFLLVVIGSLMAGFVLSKLTGFVTRPIDDPPSAIILQFVITFGVWIVADRLSLSPILTVVTYAMLVARRTPRRTSAAMRAPSYAVWETVVFLSNVLAFALVGLQIGPIVSRLSPEVLHDYALVAGATLGTVILVRMVWVMGCNAAIRLKNHWFGVDLPRPMMVPTIRSGLIISWAGMRGLVTLAAALALPAHFPWRDLILLTAFTVVVGTLVAQGLTLGPLMRAMKLHDDEPVAREVRLARVETARAALKALDGDASEPAEALRRELTAICDGAKEASDGDGRTDTPQRDLRRQTLSAQRDKLWEMRQSGAIGDDAYHRLEGEFDWLELESSG